MSLRLVVNADDLGMSSRQNDAILELIAAGRVTSATLLMNAPVLDDALRRLRALPQASFGVHLNVTQYAPLSAAPGLAPLLDAEGCFAGEARLHAARLAGALTAAIEAEWRAQIERLIAAGVTPSHLNSHNHVHTHPALLPVLRRLCRRYGVRRVRATRNLWPAGRTPSAAKRLAKTAWRIALERWVGARTTDRMADLASLLDNVAILPTRGCIEVMVHPGHPAYGEEERLLRGTWWAALRTAPVWVTWREI